jgi:hypothetical protein
MKRSRGMQVPLSHFGVSLFGGSGQLWACNCDANVPRPASCRELCTTAQVVPTLLIT